MNSGLWKWAAVAVLVLAVGAAGCSTRQTVKSDVDSSSASTGAQGSDQGVSGQAPAATQQPPEISAQQAEAALGMAVTEEKASPFADVLFEFDRSDLTEAGKKASQDVAEYMRKNPGAKLLIEGHCDATGTAEYNMALGDRRATSVKNYLVSLGVPAAALSTVSFGKERPLDPGDSAQAYARNRRAHFVLK